MKSYFSRLINTRPKQIIASAVLALAILFPLVAAAANPVSISATTEVANVTRGDTTYGSSVSASYSQVVKVQVIYDNLEAPNSGKVANNVHVKINIPTGTGVKQVITSRTGGDNTNVVNGQATVNLDRADAYLQYLPGSAVAKVTDVSGHITEGVVSDSVVTGTDGFAINNGHPCQAASITVMARVMVPGVKIDKFVRVKGTTEWTTKNTASPGDTLEYEIAYTNIGNTMQNNVVIRDNLPPMMQYVSGTTMLKNSSVTKTVPDGVVAGGVIIGNYGPGINGFVKFEVKVPSEAQLQCGMTEFRNVGVARPEGMNEYYNTAITDVTRTCANVPVYSCNLLNVSQAADRKITASVQYTAQNGATFKSVTYNFGDGSTPLTTDKTSVTYQYAKDGQFTVSANVLFSVNGKDQTVTSANCSKPVSFTTPVTPPSSELPNTGPGAVLGIFAATTIAGAIVHRLFLARRLAR